MEITSVCNDNAVFARDDKDDSFRDTICKRNIDNKNTPLSLFPFTSSLLATESHLFELSESLNGPNLKF